MVLISLWEFQGSIHPLVGVPASFAWLRASSGSLVELLRKFSVQQLSLVNAVSDKHSPHSTCFPRSVSWSSTCKFSMYRAINAVSGPSAISPRLRAAHWIPFGAKWAPTKLPAQLLAHVPNSTPMPKPMHTSSTA